MGVLKRIFGSFFRRPTKNWNVENRAHKLIEKHEKGSKPSPAPQFDSTKTYLDALSKENPEVLKSQKEKNEKLHHMLEGMVVNPEKMGEVQSKRLPEDRSKVVDHEFGYFEPDSISPGRCTIRQSLEFITGHQREPEQMTSQAIAKQYKLDVAQVQQILKHFQTLQLTLPKGAAGSELLTNELQFSNLTKSTKVLTDKAEPEKPTS